MSLAQLGQALADSDGVCQTRQALQLLLAGYCATPMDELVDSGVWEKVGQCDEPLALALLQQWNVSDTLRSLTRNEEVDPVTAAAAAQFALDTINSCPAVSVWNQHWLTFVFNGAVDGAADEVDLRLAAEYVLAVWEHNAESELAKNRDYEQQLRNVEIEKELRRQLDEANPVIEAEVKKGVDDLLELLGDKVASLNKEDRAKQRLDLEHELRQQVTSVVTLKLTTKIGSQRQAKEAVSPEVFASPDSDLLLNDDALDMLDRDGICVVPRAFEEEDMSLLQSELDALVGGGQLQPTFQASTGTRHDKIRWVEETDAHIGGVACPTVARTVRSLKGIAHRIQKKLGIRLKVPKQCMAACYDGAGAHYVAHRDNTHQPEFANNREITCVLYPNCDWEEEWGGSLRCFVDASPDDEIGTTATNVVDVVPKAGTLVVFKSKEILHEVLPAHRRRMAMSIWILKG